MKLKRFLLRYYPPGQEFLIMHTPSQHCASIAAIILEYEQSGVMKSKCIDLLDLGVRYLMPCQPERLCKVDIMHNVCVYVVQMCWVLWMK